MEVQVTNQCGPRTLDISRPSTAAMVEPLRSFPPT